MQKSKRAKFKKPLAIALGLLLVAALMLCLMPPALATGDDESPQSAVSDENPITSEPESTDISIISEPAQSSDAIVSSAASQSVEDLAISDTSASSAENSGDISAPIASSSGDVSSSYTPDAPADTSASATSQNEDSSGSRSAQSEALDDSLVAFGAPFALDAPAPGFSVDLSWVSGSALDSSVVEWGGHDTLNIGCNNQNGAAETYELVVTYKNADPTDTVSGFAFGTYTTADQLDSVESVVKNGNTLTYTLSSNFTYVGVQVGFTAPVASAIRDESADITIALYRDGILVADADSANITVDLPQLRVASTNLVTEDNLPLYTGANTTRLRYRIDMTNLSVTTHYAIKAENCVLKYDMSDIPITALGAGVSGLEMMTKTYAEWQATGNSPVTFTHDDDSALLDGKYLVLYNNEILQFSGTYMSYFKIVTTDDFNVDAEGNLPAIAFTNIVAEMTYNHNGRAPSISPVQVDSLNNLPSKEDSPVIFIFSERTLIAAPPELEIVIARPVSSSSTLLANSSQYKDNPEWNYLYNLGLADLVIDTCLSTPQSTAVEVRLDIPSGVTVSHLVLPSNNNFANAEYTIEYDGAIYNPGDVIPVSASSGESVSFLINNLQRIWCISGSRYNLATGIKIIGHTDETVASGASLTFKASAHYVGAEDWATSSVKITAVDKIKTDFMPRNSTALGYLDSAGQSLSSSITVGQSFILRGYFRPYSYPYNHFVAVDPANLSTTQYMPDPVIYFSLPAGVVPTGNMSKSSFGKDFHGTTIDASIYKIHENAGIYPGGSVVEVRFHAKDNPNGHVWVEGEKDYSVYLHVTLLPEYTEPTLDFTNATVLYSSWAPIVSSSGQVGSTASCAIGTYSNLGFVLPTDGSITTTAAAYSPNSSKSLAVVVPEELVVAIGTKTATGNYLSYISGDDTTLAEVRAGSTNEEYQVYFSNGVPGDVNTQSDLYFVLPVHNSWQPQLSGAPTLSASLSGSYTIYYSTQSGLHGKTAAQLASASWQAVDFSNAAALAAVDWGSVTAFRYSFDTLKQYDKLTMKLPFEMPAVDPASGVEYGQVALGHTAYVIDAANSDSAPTAAVKLIRSDPPVLLGKDVSLGTSASPQTLTVEYKTGTLPAWQQAYVYDDFTAGVCLQSVSVAYTPATGYKGATAATQNYTAQGGQITSAPYTSPQGYAAGTLNTIADAASFVSIQKPGTYVISYTTGNDMDTQSTTKTLTIVVRQSINPSVTYMIGSTQHDKQTNVPPGQLLLQPAAAPERTAHQFLGWFTAETGGTRWDFASDVMTFEDLTLYGRYEELLYNLTYNYAGKGTNQTIPQQHYGSTLTPPANPRYTGFDFLGWFDEDDGGRQWQFGTDTFPARDLTLTAHWAPLYKVVYINQGKTVQTLEEKRPGDTLPNLSLPARDGYAFKGWSADNGKTLWSFSGTSVDTLPAMPAGATDVVTITLTAIWEPLVFKVEFFDHDNTLLHMETVFWGASATPPASPSRSGYDFTGWLGNYQNVKQDEKVFANYTIKPPEQVSSSSSSSVRSRPSSSSSSSLSSSSDIISAPPPISDSVSSSAPVSASWSAPSGSGTVSGSTSSSVSGGISQRQLFDIINPLHGENNGNSWSLLNLLLAVGCALCAILGIAGYLVKNKREQEDDEDDANAQAPQTQTRSNKTKRLMPRIINVFVALLAVITFIITELPRIRFPMVFVNRWTLLMLLYAVVMLVFGLLMRNTKQEDEDEWEQPQT